MDVPVLGPRWKAIRVGLSSTRTAAVSVARGLSLLPSGRPRTPLRVLCIAAFDTLHVLRHGKRLPTCRLTTLAALLDFAAFTNAVFDHKAGCRDEDRATRQLLEDAGIGASVADYLRRLGDLEGGRPLPGGDRCRFQEVRTYREAVVQLSLRMVATAARGNQGFDEADETTDSDSDLLFRIVMQCQIIDDVLDYSQDRAAGLPSFLTACESLPQALELTQLAARDYADDRRVVRPADVWPLRAALAFVSSCARLAVFLRRRTHRVRREPRGVTMPAPRAESEFLSMKGVGE